MAARLRRRYRSCYQHQLLVLMSHCVSDLFIVERQYIRTHRSSRYLILKIQKRFEGRFGQTDSRGLLPCIRAIS
jgi:hypothetical protein